MVWSTKNKYFVCWHFTRRSFFLNFPLRHIHGPTWFWFAAPEKVSVRLFSGNKGLSCIRFINVSLLFLAEPRPDTSSLSSYALSRPFRAAKSVSMFCGVFRENQWHFSFAPLFIPVSKNLHWRVNPWCLCFSLPHPFLFHFPTHFFSLEMHSKIELIYISNSSVPIFHLFSCLLTKIRRLLLKFDIPDDGNEDEDKKFEAQWSLASKGRGYVLVSCLRDMYFSVVCTTTGSELWVRVLEILISRGENSIGKELFD